MQVPVQHLLYYSTSVIRKPSYGQSLRFCPQVQWIPLCIFSLTCISMVTLDNLPGELSNIDDVNVSECVEAINKNSERIIGIKIRLSADLANDGSNEPEACR